MTVYAPRFTKLQITQGIWNWTGGAWSPGLSFQAGPTANRPSIHPDKTLYYDTDTSTLWQYQDEVNDWVNLNGPGNEITTRSGSDPTSPSQGDLINRYDLEIVKEYTSG
jgi:hypothetical protein